VVGGWTFGRHSGPLNTSVGEGWERGVGKWFVFSLIELVNGGREKDGNGSEGLGSGVGGGGVGGGRGSRFRCQRRMRRMVTPT
jgi:hypothetical protein